MIRKILNQLLFCAGIACAGMMMTSCQGLIDAIFGETDNPGNNTETPAKPDPKTPTSEEEKAEDTPLTLEAIEDGTIQVTIPDELDLAKPITYTKNGVEYSGGTTNIDITVSAGDIVTFHSTNAALGKLVGYSYKHPNIKAH